MSDGWSYLLTFGDWRFELAEGENVVGRSQSCDVSIADPSVSRRHAQIVVVSGKVSVGDLGSSNGTFVNGERVDESAPLRSGDVLGLGDAEVSFEIIPPSLETVRLPAAAKPGEATTFLQQASVDLAASLDDPFVEEPPELFESDPLAAEDESSQEDWEVPPELSSEVEVPILPEAESPPSPALSAPEPAPPEPPPSAEEPPSLGPPLAEESGEVLPSLDDIDTFLESDPKPEDSKSEKSEENEKNADKPGFLGRLFGRK